MPTVPASGAVVALLLLALLSLVLLLLFLLVLAGRGWPDRQASPDEEVPPAPPLSPITNQGGCTEVPLCQPP